ncbi:MAG: PDZ domain-containing protein [Planctomycetota bacterium]|nr:MAG: PDZ domain-containing protein [Planctomycetota bacterium]
MPIAPLLLTVACQLATNDDPAALYGERWTPEAQVYKLVGPGVVSVEVYATVNNYFWGTRQEVPVSQGTGVVIDPSGLVITNAHVVTVSDRGADARTAWCEVTFSEDFGGRKYRAEIVNVDQEWDLALLRIEGKGPFRAIPLGSSDDLIKGEKVIAIGTPFGNSHSITSGILSGYHRDVTIQTPEGPKTFQGLLQTNAGINPGNSGGPLLNVYGELIGINNATNPNADNIGFAIPVNQVREILDHRLLETDHTSHFWAGLKVEDGPEGGVRVSSLHPRGPAAKAGLRIGDRVLEVDDRTVRSRSEFASALFAHGDDKIVRVRAEQGGKRNDLTLELVAPELRDSFGLLGFQAVRDTIVVRTRRNWTQPLNVLRVTQVFAGTGAERLKLLPGDMIVAVRVQPGREGGDGWTPVQSFAALVSLVRSPDFVLDSENLWILRGEESFHGRLTFDDPEITARP